MPAIMWATRALLRLYPERWQQEWGRDCLEAFELGCRDVAFSRGKLALAWHVLLEWGELLTGAARQRLPLHPLHPWRFARRDFTSALRSLRSSPMHTAIVVATLALGIGANAGLFSVLDSLLFRPLPFVNAGRLTELYNYSLRGMVQFPGFSPALVQQWRTQKDLFDRVEAYDTGVGVFEGAAGAEITEMAYVTPGLLPMLGVAPLAGRTFSDDDTQLESATPAIISESLWRARFGARPNMVGATLRINGRTHIVIGIMPASFLFPTRTTELWLPRYLSNAPDSPPEVAAMVALARTVEGVTHEHVAAEVRARGERLQASVGGDPGVTASAVVRTPHDDRQARLLHILGAGVGFLLLIVCANLSNLSWSKALVRARDAAVRSALGASRRDLLRESLLEHLMLGVAGSGAGLTVARLIVEAANRFIPQNLISGSLNPIDIDGRTVAFTLVVGMLTPLVFGLPTAIFSSRTDGTAALNQQSRSVMGSRTARRWRHGLVVAEVALAMVLLVGAALMGRSLYELVTRDRGFDTTGLVRLSVGLPAGRYTDPIARDGFTERLIARFGSLPHVTSSTAGHVPPVPSGSRFGSLEFGHTAHIAESVSVPTYRVWPDYFERIGLRLVEGRTFGASEPAGSTIVSESFAKAFWPTGSAVGGTFRFTGTATWRTIVGVATDVRQLETDDLHGAFEWFLPLRVAHGATAPASQSRSAIVEQRTFVVRTSEPAATLNLMTRAVHEVDAEAVVLHAYSGTVDDAFSEAVAQPRLVLVVLGLLAGSGLLLAAAGLYGVLSLLVAFRMREFGVRLALGATPANVFALILRHGAGLAAVGLTIGGMLTAWMVQLMQSVLYDVSAWDPMAFAAVAFTLATAAVVASWRPARRAMGADPVSLLRE